MNNESFPCGCLICSSVLGDCETYGIVLCPDHAKDPELMKLMWAAANRQRELAQKEGENA